MPRKHPLILAIDDDPLILKTLKDLLVVEGMSTITASNAINGLWLLAKRKPDLVLLDIIMPEVDGYAALEMIRKCTDVPVIMLTALNVKKGMGKAMLDCTADDYVVKPFSSKVLVARIKSKLRRRQMQESRT